MNRFRIILKRYLFSLLLLVWGLIHLSIHLSTHAETLYNGIVLPDTWPPRLSEVPNEPVMPPYLISPPDVIPIDVGRQLFVDDFLIADTTLKRTYHLATYYHHNPVLNPDQPWEGSMAMVFSDGVWYDPEDKIYKMWYMGGPDRATCYAESEDGIRWRKPVLDFNPGTNNVQSGQRDSSTVWLDLEEKDPQKRYKMFRSSQGSSTVEGAYGLATFFSPDGIHWSGKPLLTGSCGDRSTVFWNPFRKVWVYSLRLVGGNPGAAGIGKLPTCSTARNGRPSTNLPIGPERILSTPCGRI